MEIFKVIDQISQIFRYFQIPPEFDGTKELLRMYKGETKYGVEDINKIRIDARNYNDVELVSYLKHELDLDDRTRR